MQWAERYLMTNLHRLRPTQIVEILRGFIFQNYYKPEIWLPLVEKVVKGRLTMNDKAMLLHTVISAKIDDPPGFDEIH